MSGIRAAMYAEMAEAAAGRRPPLGGKDEWEVALEAALEFIRAGGFDETVGRQLLSEAFTTQQASRRRGRNAAVEATCRRLADEFRWRVRHG